MKLKFKKMMMVAAALATIMPMVTSCKTAKKEFTMLQWNVWQEGKIVPGGFDAIADEIARLSPDLVTLCEARNEEGSCFTDRMAAALKERGVEYHTLHDCRIGLFSKYPFTDTLEIFPVGDYTRGASWRVVTDVHGQKIALYAAHLDYLNDAYYDVRGYDGSTWRERSIPTSVEEVLALNDASERDDATRIIIEQAARDRQNGCAVIIGTDLNEPSHLDWIEATKDLYDHNGLVVPWTCTKLLEDAGFIDSYRYLHPDVLTYPGFTFPANNTFVELNKLTWAPKADERERIDYVFYAQPQSNGKDVARVEATKAVILGPRGEIVRSQRVEEPTADPIEVTPGIYPTDHKGVLVTFRVK